MHNRYVSLKTLKFGVNYQVATRRPGDVLSRLPKGPDVRDLQGIFRGFLRDQHKNWRFNEKSVFRCNSPYFKYLLLFYCFYWKNQHSKAVNRDVHGRLQDLFARRHGEQLMGRSEDVHKKSVIHVFKIQLRNILNLLWQAPQDFIAKIISKIDLRVCGKVPFLMLCTSKKQLTLARISPRNVYLNLYGRV